MKRWLPPLAILVCIALPAAAEDWHSDASFSPPNTDESYLYPLPQPSVAYYLSQTTTVRTFANMAGKNDAMKSAQPDSDLFQVASGYTVQMDAASIFGSPLTDGNYQVYLAGIRSTDAHAVRLLVDLSRLRADDELWLLDPTAPRAFGPFTRQTELADAKWLPTVFGDTAVLALRVRQTGLPPFRVLAISHFFWDLAEDLAAAKELACNINVACDEDLLIQHVSSGIGLILIPQGTEVFTGSGALINAPATPTEESFFFTAHHVIEDRDTALNADVIWDYRSTQCNTNDALPIAKLPRSAAKALLATSATLDATLLQLDSVPVGHYGRTYLGWDTRTPKVDEEVIVIHHPTAKHMRISYGRVLEIDQTVSNYQHETRVGWYNGVTEAGSSGSCMLFADGTYRIGGTLTGGSTQSCTFDPKQNWDYFSSMTDFYKDISPAYLTGTAGHSVYHQPTEGEGEAEGENEGEGEGETPACFGVAHLNSPAQLLGDALFLAAVLSVLAFLPARANRRD